MNCGLASLAYVMPLSRFLSVNYEMHRPKCSAPYQLFHAIAFAKSVATNPRRHSTVLPTKSVKFLRLLEQIDQHLPRFFFFMQTRTRKIVLFVNTCYRLLAPSLPTMLRSALLQNWREIAQFIA